MFGKTVPTSVKMLDTFYFASVNGIELGCLHISLVIWSHRASHTCNVCLAVVLSNHFWFALPAFYAVLLVEETMVENDG